MLPSTITLNLSEVIQKLRILEALHTQVCYIHIQ